jgi:acyl carrier protein
MTAVRTPGEVRAKIVDILRRTVPGAEVEGLDPHADLRDQLDMDSLDVLNFATGLSQELDVSVAESDYPELMTLERCTAYVLSSG